MSFSRVTTEASLMTAHKLPFGAGLPQVAAAFLLLIFLAQCLWFIALVPITSLESSYIEDGLVQLSNMAQAGAPERSPLVPVLGAIPVKLFAGKITFEQLSRYRFVIRLPFLFCGVMLGASLWYVARRLYGNFGGIIALGAVYVFPHYDRGAQQPGGRRHCRGLGGVWADLHRHRGCPYAVCAA